MRQASRDLAQYKAAMEPVVAAARGCRRAQNHLARRPKSGTVLESRNNPFFCLSPLLSPFRTRALAAISLCLSLSLACLVYLAVVAAS